MTIILLDKVLYLALFSVTMVVVLGSQTAFAGNDICFDIFIPVCGVDGITYPNECEADKAGVEVAHQGECVIVGGEFLQLDTTSLLVAGAQSTTWMIPVILSAIGIGLFAVSRKSE